MHKKCIQLGDMTWWNLPPELNEEGQKDHNAVLQDVYEIFVLPSARWTAELTIHASIKGGNGVKTRYPGPICDMNTRELSDH